MGGRRSGRLRRFLRRPPCRHCRISSSLSCWRIALGAVSAMRCSGIIVLGTFYNEYDMSQPLRERLIDLFAYDPETGELRRKASTGSRARAGDVVGTKAAQGHLVVRVDGRLMFVHHIAWTIANGAKEGGVIVHLNGNKEDNRLANFALVSKREAHAKTKAEGLSAKNVREIFEYSDGSLFWRRSLTGKNRIAGNKAGYRNCDGYIMVEVAGKAVAAHRVVWLMHAGRWPDGEIDHINGVRDDNRIENLRDVTHQTNAENRRRSVRASETGALGVTLTKDGRYRARICSKGRLLSLGVFGSADEAHAAYVAEKRRLHAGNTL